MSGATLHAEVTVARRNLTVVADVVVPPGSIVAIVGPSGAGKSTILAAVAGLVPLGRGAVRLGDRVLAVAGTGRRGTTMPLRHRRIGLLAQRPGLFPHLDVAANIGYASPGGARDPVVGELADALGLAPLLGVRPDRLSGGQRQRVALARVLAADPAALLLDEPFTGLDPVLRADVGAFVASEIVRREVPSILVTHELADAQRWAGQVAVVDEGRVLQSSDPVTVVREPADARVAGLVGYRAFVAAGALLRDAALLPAGPQPAGAVTVGVHPDQLVLGGDERLGGAARTEGRAAGAPVTAWLEATVVAVRAAGAGIQADVVVPGGAAVPVHLAAGAPVPEVGRKVVAGVVGAPWFDARGRLLG